MSKELIPDGYYLAKPIDAVCESTKSGTPCVTVLLEIYAGPQAGRSIRWNGWLTDGAAKNTAKALVAMGWQGDLSKLDLNKSVSIQIETERSTQYGDRSRVKWINPRKGLSVDHPIPAGALRTLQGQLREQISAGISEAHLPPVPRAAKPKPNQPKPAAKPVANGSDSFEDYDSFDESGDPPFLGGEHERIF